MQDKDKVDKARDDDDDDDVMLLLLLLHCFVYLLITLYCRLSLYLSAARLIRSFFQDLTRRGCCCSLLSADITFIYISIENGLGLTLIDKMLIYGRQPLTRSACAYRSFLAVPVP